MSSEPEEFLEAVRKMPGFNWLCSVEKSYLSDNFNTFGLKNCVSNFRRTMGEILDFDVDEDVTQNQVRLYGLMHHRFILSVRGMSRMKRAYQNKKYGECPRVFCRGQAVLPVGVSDTPGESAVKVFCPRCQDIFNAPQAESVDGAFFGTTFPHLFFLSFPDLQPQRKMRNPEYTPRCFGFKVFSPEFECEEEEEEEVVEYDS
eukprot:TRINITY_DN2908_c0_g1_i1.p1 TRINITY_DN2908_c0_g1~~TRINITY_DN2908_c0_g1_i1.p1  ORF type:complete len:202 (+),score=53.38 TRINITY_DN2908_c0_g1_i1:151-756(+)